MRPSLAPLLLAPTDEVLARTRGPHTARVGCGVDDGSLDGVRVVFSGLEASDVGDELQWS